MWSERCPTDRHPRSFAGWRREREARGDHRRRARSRPAARARVLAGRRPGGARGAHRDRSQDGRRGAAGTVARAARRRDRRGLQRGGRRRHRRRMGRPRRVDLQRGDLAHRGRTARDRSGGLARDPRRQPHRAFLGGARRGPGDAGRRATDLHRLGPRGTAARGAHRVQHVEGGPRRAGEGSRARSRARRHHRERRGAGLVRLAVGRAVEEPPPARGRRARAHRAAGVGAQPSDLVGMYQFLASDASAFVTGTVLNVDGGYLLV